MSKEPTDYEIIEYEQRVKDEASQMPLVAAKAETLSVLIQEYRDNPSFLAKLTSLQSDGYTEFRRCRGTPS